MVLLISGHLAAQEPSAVAPAAPTTSPAPACFPACRDAFTCHQGQCISLCNPACPAGLECVEGRRCEPPPAQSRAPTTYEPPAPPLKEFEERSHALFGFHLGFPGNLNTDGRDGDSDSALGFNLRADNPIAKYVLLGPMLQFGSWRPESTPAASHDYYVDLDVVLRFRAPLTTSKLNYQLWVGMPVGVSVGVPGKDLRDASVGYGWNIGVLFGGALHFVPKFGLFAEVGWEQHRITHPDGAQPDFDFKLQQALLNLGVVVRN
jgi:hypothetical protein